MWTKLSPPLSLSFCTCEMNTMSTRLLVAFSYSKWVHTHTHTHTHTQSYNKKWNRTQVTLWSSRLPSPALWVPRTRARDKGWTAKKVAIFSLEKSLSTKEIFQPWKYFSCMLDILISYLELRLHGDAPQLSFLDPAWNLKEGLHKTSCFILPGPHPDWVCRADCLPTAGRRRWAVEGESWSRVIISQALSPPTCESGPISVPPLTNQIYTSSFFGEYGGVSGGPWGQGLFLPKNNESDCDSSCESEGEVAQSCLTPQPHGL